MKLEANWTIVVVKADAVQRNRTRGCESDSRRCRFDPIFFNHHQAQIVAAWVGEATAPSSDYGNMM